MKFSCRYSDIKNTVSYGDRLSRLSLTSYKYSNPDRSISNKFYKKDKEWARVRNEVITRDFGCDLGIIGQYIDGPIIVHHIDPLTEEDFINYNADKLLNPDNLICCSVSTHNKIHYGEVDSGIIDRCEGDTKLW